jgi:serine/threonine protein kinase
MGEISADREDTNLRGALSEIKIIATGGMSEIFRAKQPALDRYIVVKKLKEDLLANAETVERFRREAKALASVLHQNIAHVYDFVEGSRESYILMEYIEGMDVSSVVEKVGSIPPEVAASILLGVAKGVSYIHAHHLIHRDIKPSNIRLTTRGEVKLMDFGIVVDMERDSLTRPGIMVGSPSYLSPEQVMGDSITPSADLFLLGICLYEMLTGTKPFKETEGETVFQRIREAKYIGVRKMNPAVPLALDAIVKKCLKKEAGARFQSVKDLITALEVYLGHARSSHTEDIILGFLDREALMEPAMSYAEIYDTRKSLRESLTPVVILLGLFLASLTFGLGYFFGNKTHPEPLKITAKPASKLTK